LRVAAQLVTQQAEYHKRYRRIDLHQQAQPGESVSLFVEHHAVKGGHQQNLGLQAHRPLECFHPALRRVRPRVPCQQEQQRAAHRRGDVQLNEAAVHRVGVADAASGLAAGIAEQIRDLQHQEQPKQSGDRTQGDEPFGRAKQLRRGGGGRGRRGGQRGTQADPEGTEQARGQYAKEQAPGQ
jgi:hypothetical protein